MTERELIIMLQNENNQLKRENSEMMDKLKFANRELAALFHALDDGDRIDTKDCVGYIGSNIESFLNERC